MTDKIRRKAAGIKDVPTVDDLIADSPDWADGPDWTI